MRLADLVRAKALLLDEIFGNGGYRIDADEGDLVRVRTEWMELLLVYDRRDQFVSSSAKPLNVPSELSEDCTSDTLLRFCGIEVGPRRKSALDEQQVSDELKLIEPLVSLLKDERKSRDAVSFVSGYNAAYTDWASGNWDSTT